MLDVRHDALVFVDAREVHIRLSPHEERPLVCLHAEADARSHPEQRLEPLLSRQVVPQVVAEAAVFAFQVVALVKKEASSRD